jgi:hypothetical protein
VEKDSGGVDKVYAVMNRLAGAVYGAEDAVVWVSQEEDLLGVRELRRVWRCKGVWDGKSLI